MKSKHSNTFFLPLLYYRAWDYLTLCYMNSVFCVFSSVDFVLVIEVIFLLELYYLYLLFICVRYLGGMVSPCRYTQSSIKGINIEGCKIPIGSEPLNKRTQGCKTT